MEKDRKTGLHYRAIWYYKYEIAEGNLKGKRIAVFLDERLKADKEKDYLSRIEENDTQLLENFFKNQYRLGTIAVISDLEESGESPFFIFLEFSDFMYSSPSMSLSNLAFFH